MYVLLEVWKKIMAIPIMNLLSCFMIGSEAVGTCTSYNISPMD